MLIVNLVTQAQTVRYEPQVLVDYVSAHGRQVTDVRAIVLQGALAQLKEAGHFDDYMKYFPAEYAECAAQSLASTWIPVAAVVAHYETLTRMGLSDTQIGGIGERLGASLFDQLFATIVRAVRAAGGGSGMWFGFKQADRIWARMYKGGACRIEQVGPKDAIYTLAGLPAVSSRPSRITQCAFMRGVMSHSTKACVVKVVSSAKEASDSLTLAISWV